MSGKDAYGHKGSGWLKNNSVRVFKYILTFSAKRPSPSKVSMKWILSRHPEKSGSQGLDI